MVTAKKKSKKFIIGILSSVLLLLLATGIFVYIVDPFYQYHKPWVTDEAYLSQAVYQTPGAARNLEYTDVIVGSSMTENFSADRFDELFGWNTVKLSYSGLWTDDFHAIFDQIYETHAVNHVVMSVDAYMYMDENSGTRVYAERPEYLYTKNVLDDAPYLLNRDVVKEGIKTLAMRRKGTYPNADSSYTWDYPCGLSVVMKDYAGVREEAKKNYTGDLPKDAYQKSARAALDNLEPVIASHPDTQFLIFFPAYSMLYWDEAECMGRTDAIIELHRYIIDTFLQYDNVEIHYFMTAEVTENPDYYLDTGHYNAAVSEMQTQWMKDGSYRLTKENCDEVLDAMLTKAKNYDYTKYGLYP